MFEPKIKICGITNYEDAKLSIDLGADILGFIFYEKSPRFITPEKAAEIIAKLPTVTGIAGVFVDETYERIREICDNCYLNWVQLSGNESAEFCDQLRILNVRTIKAIRVKGVEDLEKTNTYPTDAVLLDSYTQGEYGGTGKQFDWDMLKTVVAYIEKRIFISGGVNPDNAREAYEMGLYGVDLCSGVEDEPGRKSKKKMKEFFNIIKNSGA